VLTFDLIKLPACDGTFETAPANVMLPVKVAQPSNRIESPAVNAVAFTGAMVCQGAAGEVPRLASLPVR